MYLGSASRVLIQGKNQSAADLRRERVCQQTLTTLLRVSSNGIRSSERLSGAHSEQARGVDPASSGPWHRADRRITVNYDFRPFSKQNPFSKRT